MTNSQRGVDAKLLQFCPHCHSKNIVKNGHPHRDKTQFYCKNCKIYTLDKTCSKCKEKTISKNPPRFSPQDHYGKYRRKLKKLQNGE